MRRRMCFERPLCAVAWRPHCCLSRLPADWKDMCSLFPAGAYRCVAIPHEVMHLMPVCPGQMLAQEDLQSEFALMMGAPGSCGTG